MNANAPRSDAGGPPGSGAGRATPSAAGGAPKGGARARLLVAEDNPVNQEAIRRVLERRGFAVMLVENGAQVVLAATAASPDDAAFDAILMDVQMPEMDGFEATRRVRAAGVRTPIIAMTAHAMESDRQKCREAGMDAHVSKPIQRDLLFSLLESLLGLEPLPRPTGPKSPRPGSSASGATPTRAGAAGGVPGVVDLTNLAQAWADEPVLDADALMDNLDGDAAALAELLQVFARSRAAGGEAIRRAITVGDGPELRRAAHKFAGSLGAVFAMRAFRVAKALEHAGESADLAMGPWLYFELERALAAFDERVLAAQAALAGGPDRGTGGASA